MLKLAKKIAAVVLAVVTVFALTMSVGAVEIEDINSILTVPANNMFEGCKPEGDVSLDGFTMVGTVDGNNVMTVHLLLKGDALEKEFWNDPTANIEYDVTLNTDISAYTQMPGFSTGYGWVNPPQYASPVVYGKTVTYTASFMHFYNDSFSAKDPHSLLIQIGGNVTEKTDVSATISNIRVTNSDGTSTPVEGEVEGEATVEGEGTESTPEQTTAATTTASTTAEVTTAATTTAATTTAATTAATAVTTVSTANAGGFNLSAAIIAIVVIVVVIVAASIIGFILYKKKKYY